MIVTRYGYKLVCLDCRFESAQMAYNESEFEAMKDAEREAKSHVQEFDDRPGKEYYPNQGHVVRVYPFVEMHQE